MSLEAPSHKMVYADMCLYKLVILPDIFNYMKYSDYGGLMMEKPHTALISSPNINKYKYIANVDRGDSLHVVGHIRAQAKFPQRQKHLDL